MNRRLNELEERIGYQFENRDLLFDAMTHSSYANEHRIEKKRCNERLEFLGDAVLEVVSKLRASMVCEPTLALCAGEIELGKYLRLGKGEEATGGRERNSVVSDAMEALIGAIYLDGGFASAKEFIHRFVLDDIEHKQLFYDSKTILQEMVQAMGDELLSYEMIREEGPDHNKVFEARALVGAREIGRGIGRTKKGAESLAAYRGILRLKGKADGQPAGEPCI